MEILKPIISDSHDNASFYTGVIAYGKANSGKTFVLRAENEGEINFKGEYLSGEEIEAKAKAMVFNDDDFDEDNDDSEVSILVDCWLVISEAKGTELESVLYEEEYDEDRVFGYYEEALESFEEYLENN